MSSQVTTSFVQQYKENLEIQFQQMGSRLQRTVRNETQRGEYAFYDRIKTVAAVEVTNRHGDTPQIDTPHDRRRVSMTPYDFADLIDDPDRIRMLADPTNPYAVNAAMAMGRAKDDVIIAAASGTAYTGKTGSTSTTLPSASKVAVNYVESGVAANSNLTIAKLRRARFLLDKEEAVMDGEPLYLVCSASQVQSMLRTTEATSADFNTVKALVNGELNSFMGFEFIRTERLAVASSVRKCIAYPRSALILATGNEVRVRVSERNDKRHSTQVYVSMDIGAVRTWEEKLIEISCDETK